MFVLYYWLTEFLLSAFANRFELKCEPKQLMLLHYKSVLVVCSQNLCFFGGIGISACAGAAGGLKGAPQHPQREGNISRVFISGESIDQSDRAMKFAHEISAFKSHWA